MLKPKTSQFGAAQRGVALIEAMVAILIFSIGILGIVGMQANMLRNTSDSKYRADASDVAQQRIGQMWADPSNLANYAGTASVPLPAGVMTTSLSGVTAAGAIVTVTVTWQLPGDTASHVYSTVANINGG
jgi:type IV pilus assembly protein PilV